MPFSKMNGLGNDFVVLDARAGGGAPSAAAIAAMSDRRQGIGFDQLILLEPPRGSEDVYMRIFNSDGSEVEACGNASRCIGKMLIDEKGIEQATIATVAGAIGARASAGGLYTVDMGKPRLGWEDIPLSTEMDTRSLDLSIGPAGDPVLSKPGAVNMGNPHCVFFVDRVPTNDIEAFGPLIEHHELFPARTNVEFAEVQGPHKIRLRVWERGTGVTRACGSGACATAVAAHRRGLTARNVTIELDGGELQVEWQEGTDHVLMTGPAATNFTGTLDLSAFGD